MWMDFKVTRQGKLRGFRLVVAQANIVIDSDKDWPWADRALVRQRHALPSLSWVARTHRAEGEN